MADDAPAHPDPSVVPASKSIGDSKGEKESINPSQVKGLAKLPTDVKTTVSKADELILRLNKLIKTTAGLGAGLSTLNYGLYLAAYLHAEAPTRAAVVQYISRLIGRTPSKVAPGAVSPAVAVSPLTGVGALVSDTRTTLRLTGLVPLYIWMKTLLSQTGNKDIDAATHRIALLQCSAYMAYQAMENVYHLAGKSILPASFVEKRGGMLKWVTWSCRAWLIGVASEFLRLSRQAQLDKEKKERGEINAQQQAESDKKWWTEFQTAAAWLPVAIHYSLLDTGGLKGMNNGLVGLFGLIAGLNNFRNAWAATAN